jgi:hypothetical protein
MEITIGVQNLPREITLDVEKDTAEVKAQVTKALAEGAPLLELEDSRGRHVIVPTAGIAYIEIGPEQDRRVGFGSL